MTEAGEKKRAGKGHTMKHQTAVTESSATGRVRIKRAYEPATDGDGYRVLVDRLWPRGVSKDKAHLDTWMKDIAPSTELRRWFGHDPARWDEFERRYRAELAEPERSRSGAGAEPARRCVGGAGHTGAGHAHLWHPRHPPQRGRRPVRGRERHACGCARPSRGTIMAQ